MRKRLVMLVGLAVAARSRDRRGAAAEAQGVIDCRSAIETA
jgi:hypothetical protein